jgi:DNA-binding CsgD family transcriptional regulator
VAGPTEHELPPVAGRADELAAVLAPVHDALGGRASAVLVAGEAGIGKTSLVRHACAAAAGRADLIWATCLPLSLLAVPLLPLRSAVDAPEVWDAPYPVTAFDAWLDRAAARRPVLLVVDDVQWADQSSLDVLMYVLAGRPDRRLAVLLTMRGGEEENRVLRWLADVRRLPRVSELTLGRLDRVSTGEQIAALLGRPPHQSLVDEVQARALGNPYLTSLLVGDLPGDATAVPPELPSELRDALARTWRGMSAPARTLTTVVAVAGRPQRSDQIAAVADAAPLVPLLREAVDAGVLRAEPDGRYWFTHPLLAEVLAGTLLPEERRSLHAGFAALLEADGDRVIDVADHYQRAGLVEPAYRWALRAAEASDGAAESLRLLRRAQTLWPRVADPGLSRLELLHRLRTAAEHAGRDLDELAAVEELLDLETRPAARALLLVRRMRLRFSTGMEYAETAGPREAVRLTADLPGTPEHALATAELANALIWHGDPAGAELAPEALRLAEASGSDRALGYALIATVMGGYQRGRLSDTPDAARARAIAVRRRDFPLLVAATYAQVNTIEADDSRTFAGLYQRARHDLAELGAPHSYVAEMCAQEASDLLIRGDWRACRDRLRVALGGRPGMMADVRARLTAATLACRQGRQDEARSHLARAEELFRERSGFLVFNFDAVRAELAVAAGDTERAVAAAMSGLDRDVPPLGAEWLLPLAARALADRADAARDRGDDPAATLARLGELRDRHPAIPSDPALNRWQRRVVAAMAALTDAETSRAETSAARAGQDRAAGAWRRAAGLCAAAELAWDEAYCHWRAGQALLGDRSTRRAAAVALRRAHAMATDLEAAPLIAELTALATGARIPLTEVGEPAGDDRPPLPGLTTREREILGHVVAGRTYAEIAAALVVSEKTVSAHVSNMLRKTGTTNRIELAQLAHRRSRSGHEPAVGQHRHGG